MLKSRTYLLTGLAVAAALTLSACTNGTAPNASSDSSSVPSASAAFAPADVTFAQMMIPHHEQAVEMSDSIVAKDGIDKRILDLATHIKAAQQPEITQLKAWLRDWGTDEASTQGMDGMSGMGDGSDGMMSDGDMTALTDATGADAGKLYLKQMIVHHDGAVRMAQLELDEGQNVDAKAMASNIVKSQTDEIGIMKDILATL
ncbi:DUF305 domain-containing protein [Cryobacterium sp. HLT2-28]|uniref:DUF305 domain-containing protein n=1 Tax=Cryobacterium sp. HLT2-28 TaxID=1259146 RepID=UPI0018E0A469|nr:DUF305 domain-containing protein [Cryobacterium sp. HLT2-28]